MILQNFIQKELSSLLHKNDYKLDFFDFKFNTDFIGAESSINSRIICAFKKSNTMLVYNQDKDSIAIELPNCSENVIPMDSNAYKQAALVSSTLLLIKKRLTSYLNESLFSELNNFGLADRLRVNITGMFIEALALEVTIVRDRIDSTFFEYSLVPDNTTIKIIGLSEKDLLDTTKAIVISKTLNE